MAKVMITLKIMPKSPESDLSKITEEAKKKIEDSEGIVHKTETEPIAFGLVAVKIIFMRDESKGATDKLEEDIAKSENIESVEVIDVRRAFG